MKAAQRAQFKKQLAALEKELTSKGPERIVPNRSPEEEAVPDEDEQPLNEMMQSIASSQNRNRDVVLIRVRTALKKIASQPGEYGVCEECGDDIPVGRLKAMPYAELCAECQGQRDAPKGMPTRRKLTDFL